MLDTYHILIRHMWLAVIIFNSEEMEHARHHGISWRVLTDLDNSGPKVDIFVA